jgi:hypothetical protein
MVATMDADLDVNYEMKDVSETLTPHPDRRLVN